MRWPKSPAPSRRAPARSAVIGTSMRRAMMVPAMIATTRPSAINSAIRTSWSRIGVSACAVGCSKNTCQPSRGTALDVVSTRMAGGCRCPSSAQRRPAPITAATCGRLGEILADIRAPWPNSPAPGPWRRRYRHTPTLPTWVSPRNSPRKRRSISATVTLRVRMRQRDRHHGCSSRKYGTRKAGAARDGAR